MNSHEKKRVFVTLLQNCESILNISKNLIRLINTIECYIDRGIRNSLSVKVGKGGGGSWAGTRTRTRLTISQIT